MVIDMALRDIDQSIWEEELAPFVPEKVFDMHTHLFLAEHCLQSTTDDPWPRPVWLDTQLPRADREYLLDCHTRLFPGRQMQHLFIGHPFARCDFDGLNAFVATEAQKEPMPAGLMVVHPSMTPDQVADAIESLGLIGLKPYRWYSQDAVECRITDMLPEPQIEVADDRGLIVTLHLGKSAAISDPDNIADVVHLSQRYRNVRWILAHCARSFAPWPLERTIDQLRDLPNVWFDTAAVCDSDVFDILLRAIPIERILYGSDNVPAGIERGKYINFGYAWTAISEDQAPFQLSHCNPQFTFVVYESLRALRRAVQRVGLSPQQIQDLFWNNAVTLVQSVRERNAHSKTQS